MMRIGKALINTDEMTVEELTVIITELRNIRKRKEQANELRARMNDLIAEARNNGFAFIDKDFGYVRELNDFEVHDEKA